MMVMLRSVRVAILAMENNKYYIFRVCVSVALGIQNAMRMRHIAICGLPSYTIFSHIISKTARC